MPLVLHAVLINKDVGLEKAKKMAQDIIKDKKKSYYRETENTFRFKNIPKTKFESSTFKSKKINKDITLIFGELK